MDEHERILNEYNQIQQNRRLFSTLIMDWLRVMIPVGGGLFGLFSYFAQGPFASLCGSWLLPLLGWLFFAVPMFTWRIVVHHISRQITAMYPRILELKQRLGWSVDTVYYYNNLSAAGRQILDNYLAGLPNLPERQNYPLYRRACGQNRVDPHGLLLHVWEQQGYHSVGSRGHAPQDVAVYLVSIVALIIASMLAHTTDSYYAALYAISTLFFLGATCVFSMVIWHGRAWN